MTEKVKIRFNLNPEDAQGYEVENLWAEPLEDHNFRILNSPFFVFDISFDDVVKAVANDSVLQYAGIARRGGIPRIGFSCKMNAPLRILPFKSTGGPFLYKAPPWKMQLIVWLR
jgi:hypothetical protein